MTLGGLPALKYDDQFFHDDKVLNVLTSKDHTAYSLKFHHLRGKPLPDFTEEIINSFEFIS
jgi:hypothetical protein